MSKTINIYFLLIILFTISKFIPFNYQLNFISDELKDLFNMSIIVSFLIIFAIKIVYYKTPKFVNSILLVFYLIVLSICLLFLSIMKQNHNKIYENGTLCKNKTNYEEYTYCTPPVKLLDSKQCNKFYGDDWEDSGGARCRKKRAITDSSYYYPKSKQDCFDRNMKPIKAANGSLICKKSN